MNTTIRVTRRQFVAHVAGAAAATTVQRSAAAQAADAPFQLRYLLASAMYGCTALTEIVPQVKKVGATAIDIWPRVHGNQREQIEQMGRQRFAELLARFNVRLGGIACYRLGPFALQGEMRFVTQVGAREVVLVCGARGPKRLLGSALKAAIRQFVQKMEPHTAFAQQTGCTIAIENHANTLIHSLDSIRWFAEMATHDHLGIALAPHHLAQDAELIARIAADVGPKIKLFYAQQHGMGSTKKLPQEQQMLQMPGRGRLDFRPILSALKKVRFQGYTEIFMHPVPRGVPILESTAAITREITRSRAYLTRCLQEV